jgi:hypothetical protein
VRITQLTVNYGLLAVVDEMNAQQSAVKQTPPPPSNQQQAYRPLLDSYVSTPTPSSLPQVKCTVSSLQDRLERLQSTQHAFVGHIRATPCAMVF